MRALLVVWCVLATVASAQAQQPRNDRRGGGDQQVAQDRREAIKKKIRVLRAATLTDELNLDEKTLSRLLPVLSRWDDVTEDLLKKRIDIQRRLSAADATKDPRGVDKLIDEAVANQKQFWELEEKRLAELRKILNPGQVAKLLVVLPAFERKIQNQLRRAINRRDAVDRNIPDDDDDPDPDTVPRRRR